MSQEKSTVATQYDNMPSSSFRYYYRVSFGRCISWFSMVFRNSLELVPLVLWSQHIAGRPRPWLKMSLQCHKKLQSSNPWRWAPWSSELELLEFETGVPKIADPKAHGNRGLNFWYLPLVHSMFALKPCKNRVISAVWSTTPCGRQEWQTPSRFWKKIK